jgi:hypothetical protein
MPGDKFVVSFHVVSALPVDSATVIVNGEPHAVIVLPSAPEGTDCDTTLGVFLYESSWMALRVDGETDLRHASSEDLFAHTAPIYVHMNGNPVRQTPAAARFLDRIDSLEAFMEIRDHWPDEETHQAALARLDAARVFYRSLFVVPPASFTLIAPEDGAAYGCQETISFDWTDADDPEVGDRVTYILEIAADSAFASLRDQEETQASLAAFVPDVEPGRLYWWRVAARDRGGLITLCDPPFRSIFIDESGGVEPEGPPGSPGVPPPGIAASLQAAPNPARTEVALWLDPPGNGPWELRVVDPQGRLVLEGRTDDLSGPALRSGGAGRLFWNGRDGDGRLLKSGIYWLQARALDAPARGEAQDWIGTRLVWISP